MTFMGRSRRQLLAALGATVVAGCSGGGDGEGGETDTPADDGDSETPTSDGDGQNGTTTPEETGTEAVPTPPPSDADPREFLPEPPTGWEQGELVEQTADSLESIGAEAGYGAFYTDPDGGEYYVEVLRWPSAGDAESGWAETYSESPSWLVYVTRNNFSFAANGPDTDGVAEAVVTLVGNSPILTEGYIDRSNRAG